MYKVLDSMKYLLFLCLLLLSACTGLNYYSGVIRVAANTNPVPDYAGAYTMARGGVIFYEDLVEGQIGENIEKASKKGEACSSSLFFALSFGDSSIHMAKKKAKISKIKFVNHRIEALLGGFLYHVHCTVVEGE